VKASTPALLSPNRHAQHASALLCSALPTLGWAGLCCAVLCCAGLCCAVLCCAVLCCAVLLCVVLCYAVLCCAVSQDVCLEMQSGTVTELLSCEEHRYTESLFLLVPLCPSLYFSLPF